MASPRMRAGRGISDPRQQSRTRRSADQRPRPPPFRSSLDSTPGAELRQESFPSGAENRGLSGRCTAYGRAAFGPVTISAKARRTSGKGRSGSAGGRRVNIGVPPLMVEADTTRTEPPGTSTVVAAMDMLPWESPLLRLCHYARLSCHRSAEISNERFHRKRNARRMDSSSCTKNHNGCKRPG